jgi:hypothetical protein
MSSLDEISNTIKNMTISEKGEEQGEERGEENHISIKDIPDFYDIIAGIVRLSSYDIQGILFNTRNKYNRYDIIFIGLILEDFLIDPKEGKIENVLYTALLILSNHNHTRDFAAEIQIMINWIYCYDYTPDIYGCVGIIQSVHDLFMEMTGIQGSVGVFKTMYDIHIADMPDV